MSWVTQDGTKFLLNRYHAIPGSSKSLRWPAVTKRVVQKKAHEIPSILESVLTVLSLVQGSAPYQGSAFNLAVTQIRPYLCAVGLLGTSRKLFQELSKKECSFPLASNICRFVGFGALSAPIFLYNEALKKQWGARFFQVGVLSLGAVAILEFAIALKDLYKIHRNPSPDIIKFYGIKPLHTLAPIPSLVLARKRSQLICRVAKISITFLSAALVATLKFYQIQFSPFIQISLCCLNLSGTAFGFKATAIREGSMFWAQL